MSEENNTSDEAIPLLHTICGKILKALDHEIIIDSSIIILTYSSKDIRRGKVTTIYLL